MCVVTDQVENIMARFAVMVVLVSLREASEEDLCIRALVSS
jgi:hypothetical protein